VSDEPEFLTVDDVLEIHRDQIERYGGDEGIRDNGLLESAVPMPQQSFGGEYLHRDIFEMAAAYAFHLAESQAFVDGEQADRACGRVHVPCVERSQALRAW
jgi:death on curing protein